MTPPDCRAEQRGPGRDLTVRTLTEYIGRCIVLDTQGPLVYIGVLEDFEDCGFWLLDVDVHDRDEGHSTKEKYINDASLLHRTGTRPVNRRRVFVERRAVVSVSALDDVITDER
jgi:hypothetical protein